MESHPPSNHPPLLRTRVLKLEPKCCTECARKVKRAMLKVEGVHSIKVNAKEGTIEVNSEIDPQVLIAMAAKAGKRAELLWEPEPESREDISTATPPPLATPSTCQRQVHVSNFDGSFDHTVHLQDLVDKNAQGIKHMEIIDKRVIKITFKESHDDPSSDHSRDLPSLITPPSSDNKNSNDGGGEASGSGACGNVEVVAPPATTAEPPSKINSKTAEPPVANENCSSRGNSCRLM